MEIITNEGFVFVNVLVPGLHEDEFTLSPMINTPMDIQNKPFDIILGNDFLRFIHFVRDGKHGKFSITLDV